MCGMTVEEYDEFADLLCMKPQDRKRGLELLGKVCQTVEHYNELKTASLAMKKLLSDGDVDFGDCDIVDRWEKAISERSR